MGDKIESSIIQGQVELRRQPGHGASPGGRLATGCAGGAPSGERARSAGGLSRTVLCSYIFPQGGAREREGGGAIAPARGSKDFIIWCGCVCLAHAHGFAEAFPSDSNAPVVVPFLFFTFHLCGRASLTNRNQETILANRETPRVLRYCQ